MITFPIYIKFPKTDEPVKDIYYIVAKNGIFLRKKNNWVDCIVPVKQIAILLDEQPVKMRLLLPSLNKAIMVKAIRFFEAVYNKQGTEAVILLYFNKEKGYEIFVPQQTVNSVHVDYNTTELVEGYRCVGTIHSHHRMTAFHSPTDQDDEKSFDGVHITIGEIERTADNQLSFTFDPEVVVNGYRFKIGLEWFDGIKEKKSKAEEEAEEELEKTEELDKVVYRDFQRKLKKWKYWQFNFRESKRYIIDYKDCHCNDCQDIADWQVPEEWLLRVEKESYFSQDFSEWFKTPILLDNKEGGKNAH